MHEVGLYGLLQQGQAPSTVRLSIVFECFDATMKCFSLVLDTPLEEMADWTVLDWRSLNFGIMLSTKSSIILDSAYVSMEATQRVAWLGKCLDTLCSRALELHQLQGKECSWFSKLAHDWENVKVYHQNCIHKALQSATTAITTQHQPQLSVQASQQPTGVQYMDNAYLDPFNEMFWAGFAESDQAMNGLFAAM